MEDLSRNNSEILTFENKNFLKRNSKTKIFYLRKNNSLKVSKKTNKMINKKKLSLFIDNEKKKNMLDFINTIFQKNQKSIQEKKNKENDFKLTKKNLNKKFKKEKRNLSIYNLLNLVEKEKKNNLMKIKYKKKTNFSLKSKMCSKFYLTPLDIKELIPEKLIRINKIEKSKSVIKICLKKNKKICLINNENFLEKKIQRNFCNFFLDERNLKKIPVKNYKIHFFKSNLKRTNKISKKKLFLLSIFRKL